MPRRLESSLERACRAKAEKLGILCLKLYVRGMPDRLLLNNGKIVFVEFKREGEVLRKLQVWWAMRLRERGFTVYRIDTVQEFEKILKRML